MAREITMKTAALVDKFVGPVEDALRGLQKSSSAERTIDGEKTAAGIEGTLLWAVGLFGGLENVTLLLAIVCFRHSRRRPLHILVGSMAVGDLFVSFVYLPSYTLLLLGSASSPSSASSSLLSSHHGASEHELTTPADDLALLQDGRSVSTAGLKSDNGDVGKFVFCVLLRGLLMQAVSLTLTASLLVMIYFYALTLPTRTTKKYFGACKMLACITLTSLLTFLLIYLPVSLGSGERVDIYFEYDVCSLHTGSGGSSSSANSQQPSHQNGPATTTASTTSTLVAKSSSLTIAYGHLIALLHLIEIALSGAFYAKLYIVIRRRSQTPSRQPLHRLSSSASVDAARLILHNNYYSNALRTTSILFASVLVFWLPACVVGLMSTTSLVTFSSRLPHRLALDLLLLKSAVNPIIYVYGVRSLRRSIRFLCLCNCQTFEDRIRYSMTEDDCDNDDCMELGSLNNV